jgi:hypothetical protein
MHWLWENRQWVFSGVGLSVVALGAWIFRASLARLFRKPQPSAAVPLQGDVSVGDGSPVAAGNNIQQTIKDSYNTTVALPALVANKRYEEWQKLIQEFPKILDEMAEAFSNKSWRQGGIIDVDGDDQKPFAAIRRGNLMVQGQLYIAEVFKNSGLLDKWNELVKGTEAGDFERGPNELGYSSISRFMRKKHTFMAELTRVAREDLK